MEVVRLDINYDGTLKAQSSSARFSFATSVTANKEYLINVSVVAGFSATVTINKIVVESIKPSNELLATFDSPLPNKIIATFRPDVGQNKINTESVLLLFIDFSSSGGNGPIPGASTYDFIVVGSGPAGAACAFRLSDVKDGNGNYLYNVLLLEAGKNYLADANVVVPLNFGNLQAGGKYVQFLLNIAEPNVLAPSGANVVILGRCVGGGSSHNYMQIIRPSPALLNAWANYGGTQWNYANMLQYLKKFENASQFTTITPNPANRGLTGPVMLRDVPNNVPISPTIATAVTNVGNTAKYNHTVIPTVNDMNNGDEIYVCTHEEYFQTATPGSYIRSHVGTSYLSPSVIDANGNGLNGRKLTVKAECPVIKVLFDSNNKTNGVLYLDQTTNTVVPVNLNNQTLSGGLTAQAVLSAGLNDAPILLRSGVGDQALLGPLNIPVKYHNPWVGQNLQNHAGLTAWISCSNPTKVQAMFADFNNFGIIPVLWMTTRMTQAAQTMRKWQIMFAPSFSPNSAASAAGIDVSTGIEIIAWNVQPYSRGNVKITDGQVANVPTVLQNFSTDAGGIDRAEIIELIKLIPDIVVKLTAADGVDTYDMLYPPNSLYNFQMSGLNYVLDADGFRIPQATDNQLLAWWKANNGEGAHWSGSCRMAANGNIDATEATGRGVVDGNLNVYGVTGLKVADVQISPIISNSNTCTMAYAIGEKAADIILAGN